MKRNYIREKEEEASFSFSKTQNANWIANELTDTVCAKLLQLQYLDEFVVGFIRFVTSIHCFFLHFILSFFLLFVALCSCNERKKSQIGSTSHSSLLCIANLLLHWLKLHFGKETGKTYTNVETQCTKFVDLNCVSESMTGSSIRAGALITAFERIIWT